MDLSLTTCVLGVAEGTWSVGGASGTWRVQSARHTADVSWSAPPPPESEHFMRQAVTSMALADPRFSTPPQQ